MKGNFVENIHLIWLIRGLSFLVLILTLYATANILQSIWFRFWSSRSMSDEEKVKFYVAQKCDVKWSLTLTLVCLLGVPLSVLIGLPKQIGWHFLCSFLFGFLLWGNYRTLKIEKDRLKRKEDFNI